MEKSNIVFGIRPVVEAIESGKQIEKIYIRRGAEGQLMTDLRDLCYRHRLHVQEVPVEKLNRLTRGSHQGVVAQIAAIDYVEVSDILERVPEDETPLIVLFDGVTDVRNFGGIARSAECAGAHGIITSLKSSAPVNSEAMKASAGALTRIPVCRVGSVRNTIKSLRAEGFQIVAATEHSRNPLCYNGNLNSVEEIAAFSSQFPQIEAVMIGRGLIGDPGMLVPGGTQVEALEQFTAELLETYIDVFGGARNAMFRMKENWGFLLPRFEDSEKLGKQLRKTTDVNEYRAITAQIFRTLPLAKKLLADW